MSKKQKSKKIRKQFAYITSAKNKNIFRLLLLKLEKENERNDIN